VESSWGRLRAGLDSSEGGASPWDGHALIVFRFHYQKIDLEVLSEGYVNIPKEELDAINEEVLEPTKTLVAKFEEEVNPLPLDL
jgi:hypothetical protein